jgi:hypothetical protein
VALQLAEVGARVVLVAPSIDELEETAMWGPTPPIGRELGTSRSIVRSEDRVCHSWIERSLGRWSSPSYLSAREDGREAARELRQTRRA